MSREAGLVMERAGTGELGWELGIERRRELGDNLGGDWFSRLGPAGTRRSLFIGEARSARCGDGCEPANLTSTGVRLSESSGDTAAEKPRPGAVGLDSRDSRDSRRSVEPSSQKGVVQGLSPVRELRAIERLPHSEKDEAKVRCARDTVLGGKMGNGRSVGLAPGRLSRGFAVGWRVAGTRRELGRKQLVSPGCRMFLLLRDGQRQRHWAWWVFQRDGRIHGWGALWCTGSQALTHSTSPFFTGQQAGPRS